MLPALVVRYSGGQCVAEPVVQARALAEPVQKTTAAGRGAGTRQALK